MSKSKNRYSVLIEDIFFTNYEKGNDKVNFKREDLKETAKKLDIDLPKNLGDVIYSFRYRADLPESIMKTAPSGLQWVIRSSGSSLYSFCLTKEARIQPNNNLTVTKILDSTPGIIEKYAFNDAQALLAKLRYNRLIDIFTGITCYSLQSHLRTNVVGIGQIETDEIYVGIDKKGRQFVFPVQGKGGNDQIGIVQIEQDFDLCKKRFPSLICHPIAAQFIDKDIICLFIFEKIENEISISDEKHYSLVHSERFSDEELLGYQNMVS